MLNNMISQDSKQLFELGMEDAASFKILSRIVSLWKRMKKRKDPETKIAVVTNGLKMP